MNNKCYARLDVPARGITKESMQKDFEYDIAQKITKSLLEIGLLSRGEFEKVSVLNIQSFQPIYADIMDF